MMKLHVFFVPSELDEGARAERVVVIDVLRSCTSLACAIESGADKIIPVESVEAATKLLSTLPRESTLLCGERDGKKIKGFDLGNSPLEYTEEVVSGKTLIFSSTNGTKAVARGAFAKEILLLSFVNLQAVSDYLVKNTGDVFVLCSGKSGQSSLEDTVCAGMLVDRMMSGNDNFEINDAAQIALITAKECGDNVGKMISESSHGRYLSSLGYDTDLDICGSVDSIPVIPIVRDGRIERERSLKSRDSLDFSEK